MNLHISLSPHARLLCETVAHDEDAIVALGPSLTEESGDGLLTVFRVSSADGLLLLAGQAIREALPADLVFWRDWSRRFFQTVCQLDEERQAEFAAATSLQALKRLVPPPDNLALAVLIAEAPPMRGLEYLTPDVLVGLWFELAELVRDRAAEKRAG